MSLPHTFFIGRSGGVAPIIFPGIPDTLMSLQSNRLAKYDLSNWGGAPTLTNSYLSGTSWPGRVSDVAVDENDVAWVYTKKTGTAVASVRVSDLGGNYQSNLSISGSIGSIVTLRNGLIVVHDTNGTLKSYQIGTAGNLHPTGHTTTSSVPTGVTRMISPPDPTNGNDLTKHYNTTYSVETLGSYAGQTGGILQNGTCTLVLASTNNYLTVYRVSAAGVFTPTGNLQMGGQPTAMTYWPNGTIIAHLNNQKPTHVKCEWPSFVPLVKGTSSTLNAGQVFTTAWSRSGHNYWGGDGWRLSRGYDNLTINAMANPANSTNQMTYSTYTYQTMPAAFVNVPQYITSVIGIGANVYWSGYDATYGWTKVARFTELNGSGGQNNFGGNTNVSVNSSTSTQSTSDLLSGRPDWANTDEHFVEGWA